MKSQSIRLVTSSATTLGKGLENGSVRINIPRLVELHSSIRVSRSWAGRDIPLIEDIRSFVGRFRSRDGRFVWWAGDFQSRAGEFISRISRGVWPISQDRSPAGRFISPTACLIPGSDGTFPRSRSADHVTHHSFLSDERHDDETQHQQRLFQTLGPGARLSRAAAATRMERGCNGSESQEV